MRKVIIISVSFFLLTNFYTAYAGEVKQYYFWSNSLKEMSEVYGKEIIPILQNGTNYRVVKIENFKGKRINKVYVNSRFVNVELFQLPAIKDYKKKDILDLIVPIKEKEALIESSRSKYFLLKYNGLSSGNERIKIDIATNSRVYRIEQNVLISNNRYIQNLSFNVWAYFDYNFLVKDIKEQVCIDLINHGVNTLIIPPYVLPAVGEVSKNSNEKLKSYLRGTENKFKFYILYLGGSTDKDNSMMSAQWKNKIKTWHNSIMQVFRELKIEENKVLLYPIDEPRGANIVKLNEMYAFLRRNGINNPFFSTIESEDAAFLSNKIEYIQVHSAKPNLVQAVQKQKSKQTKVWIYEATQFSRSRDLSPRNYVNMGFKTYLFNAEGLGVWNYADVSRLISAKGANEFIRGKGSWELDITNPTYDYSLIYRKKNRIYSSLRWEALCLGMQENFWLELHKKKYGDKATNLLVEKLLSNQVSLEDWEKIKLDLSK